MDRKNRTRVPAAALCGDDYPVHEDALDAFQSSLPYPSICSAAADNTGGGINHKETNHNQAGNASLPLPGTADSAMRAFFPGGAPTGIGPEGCPVALTSYGTFSAVIGDIVPIR